MQSFEGKKLLRKLIFLSVCIIIRCKGRVCTKRVILLKPGFHLFVTVVAKSSNKMPHSLDAFYHLLAVLKPAMVGCRCVTPVCTSDMLKACTTKWKPELNANYLVCARHLCIIIKILTLQIVYFRRC